MKSFIRPKHKLGDIIYIKPIDWYNEVREPNGYVEYGPFPSFNENMSIFCGRKAKIVQLEPSMMSNFINYRLDIDNGRWFWSDYMLKDIKEIRKEKLEKLEFF